MEFLTIGVIIYLIYLTGRIGKLETLLKQRDLATPIPLLPTPPVQTAAIPPTYQNTAPPVQFSPIPAPQGDSPFVAWIKKDFLVKLGALLLLLATGWFVSYAFANNWIGPIGRIFLGLCLGAVFMGGGVWRIRPYVQQGALFVALGSGVVLVTMYTARNLYDFFNPAAALLVMFASVAFAAYISVRIRSQNLALAALVLGLIAPFLTNSPDPNELGLFAYVAVIIIGTIWVVALLQADILLLVAYVLVTLFSLPFVFMGEGTIISLLFGFLFTTLFFVANLKSILHRNDTETHPVNLIIAAGTGLYVASWIQTKMHLWQGAVYIAWAAVFSLGAYLVWSRTKKTAPVYVYGAVAIGLLGAATAAFFSGPVLAIAYSLEVSVLVVLAGLLIESDWAVERVLFLYIGPLLLSLEHIFSSDWQLGFMHAHFVVLLVSAAGFFVSGTTLLTLPSPVKKDIGAGLLSLSSVYALLLAWLILHAVLPYDIATMASLFGYTLIGLVLYIHGVSEGAQKLKLFGACLLGFVLLRLLVVDVWQMALTGRIITFFVIGVLLISTAFIGKLNAPKQ